jgi:cell division protein FtsB
MARENQGLQIALIVVVMLTIILGATAFITYRQSTDTALKLKAAQDENNKLSRRVQDAEEAVKDLKHLVGAA